MMSEDNTQQTYGYEHYAQTISPVGGKRGFFEKVFGVRVGRKMKPVFAGGVAIFVLAGGISYFVAQGTQTDQGASGIPVIKSDSEPMRSIPADAGGMDIPHRDSTVYSTMREAALQEQNPLPADDAAQEEPVDQLTAFANEIEKMDGLKGGSARVENLAQIQDAQDDTEVASLIPREVKIVAAEEVSAPIIEEEVDVPALKAVPPRMAEAVAAVEPAASNASAEPLAEAPQATMGTYYVQLGSVKSEDGARGEWERLSKAFSAQLAGRSAYRVKRADLGERGVFYRIQAGPMPKEAALDMCDAIKAQKPQGCIVVR